jgi:hypothetical protein
LFRGKSFNVLKVVGIVTGFLANRVAFIGLERPREGDLLNFVEMIHGLVDIEV